SSPFFPFVQKMAQLGVTGGCKTGLYCPSDGVTRGEMAVFIVTGLLNQLLPSTTPLITQASPNSGAQGQTVTVTLTGSGTHFDSGTQIKMPVTFVPYNISVANATTLTFQLDITPEALRSFADAKGSPYTIVVTTGSEEADLTNGFTVQ